MPESMHVSHVDGDLCGGVRVCVDMSTEQYPLGPSYPWCPYPQSTTCQSKILGTLCLDIHVLFSLLLFSQQYSATSIIQHLACIRYKSSRDDLKCIE